AVYLIGDAVVRQIPDEQIREVDEEPIDLENAAERVSELGQEAPPALIEPALADVPRDRRRADDAPGIVPDRGNRQRDGDPAAAFVETEGLVVLEPLTLAQIRQDTRNIVQELGRCEDRH